MFLRNILLPVGLIRHLSRMFVHILVRIIKVGLFSPNCGPFAYQLLINVYFLYQILAILLLLRYRFIVHSVLVLINHLDGMVDILLF